MNGFIAKPFDVDQMIALIQSRTSHRLPNFSAITAKLNDSSRDHAPQPEGARNPKVLPDLDWLGGLKLWHDAAKYQIYLNKFRNSYVDTAQAIAKYCLDGNLAAAAALAHKLKGTAGTLALPRVAELAGKLENVLKSGQPASEMAISELRAAIEAVCAAITSLGSNAITPKALTSPPAINDHERRELGQAFKELLEGLDDYDLKAAESALGALQARLDSSHLDQIKDSLADFDYSKTKALARALMLELNIPIDE